MASWRDEVSEQAQSELDGLLAAVLPFAEQMLGDHGEFFPYGATVDDDGDIRLVAGDPGVGDQPDPNDVLSVLYDELRERAEGEGPEADVAATVVLSDVRLVEPPTAAIRAELEHREGVAITVLVHYDLLEEEVEEGIERALSLGAVQGVQGERRTWPEPAA